MVADRDGPAGPHISRGGRQLLQQVRSESLDASILVEKLEDYADDLEGQASLEQANARKEYMQAHGSIFLPTIDFSNAALFAGEVKSHGVSFYPLASMVQTTGSTSN